MVEVIERPASVGDVAIELVTGIEELESLLALKWYSGIDPSSGWFQAGAIFMAAVLAGLV